MKKGLKNKKKKKKKLGVIKSLNDAGISFGVKN